MEIDIETMQRLGETYTKQGNWLYAANVYHLLMQECISRNEARENEQLAQLEREQGL